MIEVLEIDDRMDDEDHTPYYHLMNWIMGADIQISEKLYLDQRKYSPPMLWFKILLYYKLFLI